jgi:hypothetical protein
MHHFTSVISAVGRNNRKASLMHMPPQTQSLKTELLEAVENDLCMFYQCEPATITPDTSRLTVIIPEVSWCLLKE